ncbi:MAG: hypothetical protein OIF47_04710 [Marinibacterium sp.]|nr:hypothetical protein [Marinibacterium sp.]
MSQRRFNIVIIAQAGRLQYEALMFAASLRRHSPGFAGRLIVGVPRAGPLWPTDPAPDDLQVMRALGDLGAERLYFDCRTFGASYPNGNKIEVLRALPRGEPFVFFDSDTLITGDLAQVPFDFARPSASCRVEATWPRVGHDTPGRGRIWRALYDRFGLAFNGSLDPDIPRGWRRFLYFNAGYFYGACPQRFGALYLRIARSIRDAPPPELAGQPLFPWLDQIALPLVIHALGGGRDPAVAAALDGPVSHHYRLLSLLYARAPDPVVATLEQICTDPDLGPILSRHAPIRTMVQQQRGAEARALFDRNALPCTEAPLRRRLKAQGLWIR